MSIPKSSLLVSRLSTSLLNCPKKFARSWAYSSISLRADLIDWLWIGDPIEAVP